MNRKHFNTAKGKPNKITHYGVRRNGNIYIKTATEFAVQGGLTELWGKNWRPIVAASDDEARQKAQVAL